MNGRWLVSLVVAALLLAWPGYWLAGAYEDTLRAGLGMLMGVSLGRRPEGQVDLAATNALVLFAAACLVTTSASWPHRLRALCIGVLAMMALEFATGLVAVAAGATGNASDTSRWLLEWPQLLSAPVLWLALMAPRQVSMKRPRIA